MAALFAALLNARGHFAAPMWTPILNNIVVIVTAGLFALVHTGAPRDAAIDHRRRDRGPRHRHDPRHRRPGGRVCCPALRKVGFRWRWRWDFRALDLRELAGLGSWMLLYVAVSQIGVIVVIKSPRWPATRERLARPSTTTPS